MHNQNAATFGARMELSEFMNKVFMVMAAGLMVTAAVGYALALNEGMLSWLFSTYQEIDSDGELVTKIAASGWWWIAAALQLVMVFVMAGRGFSGHMPLSVGLPLFMFYAALNGVTIAPMLYAYTAVSVAKVFLIAAIMFTTSALWGWTTKYDMSRWGQFFLMALIGLIVAMVVNMFVGAALMDYVISVIAVVLFAGITAYDMQMLRDLHGDANSHEGLVVAGALTLYLDFINMFLHLLRLFGGKGD